MTERHFLVIVKKTENGSILQCPFCNRVIEYNNGRISVKRKGEFRAVHTFKNLDFIGELDLGVMQ